MRFLTRLCSLALLASLCTGCSIVLPDVSTMPAVHNPFPQLSRVAVTPFFNLSDEPTVDGREFALAYFAELQMVPGFEVVPLGVVEQTMIDERIDLSQPDQVRRLAHLLGVDAVVVGAVTDFSPYYPPRCGMRVEWYSANPGFHEIPAGYGLPWGTPEEEYIPQDVVFEAEMALARAQLDTQSPECPEPGEPIRMPPTNAMPLYPESMIPPAEGTPSAAPPAKPKPPVGPLPPAAAKDPIDLFDKFGQEPSKPAGELLPAPADDQGPVSRDGFDIEDDDPLDPVNPNDAVTPNAPSNDAANDTANGAPQGADSPPEAVPTKETDAPSAWRPQRQRTYKVPVDAAQASQAVDATVMDRAIEPASQNNFASPLPANWPDPRGFIPPGPCAVRPECMPNNGPVMTHTRIFLGHDPEFTAALAAYVDFRDDARFGGWRSYLERSEDFIRFCCHLHISEMLSARGGASETRVVRHWSNSR